MRFLPACAFCKDVRFAVMYVLGIPFAALCVAYIVVALICGRIRVEGYWRTWRLLMKGNVLIVSNHPSLLEAFALPSLFWVWQFWRPRCFPWNIADTQLLGKYGRWLYPALRCIPVDRRELNGGPSRKAALKSVREILKRNGSLIIYPEEGRTCKGESFIYLGNDRVRTCNPNAINLARTARATVIPVWVEYGDIEQPRSLWADFAKLTRTPLRIRFGNPHVCDEKMTATDVALMLLGRS
jgi:1-acyl-sn-glycerol-3-phosphate acyltransferase